MPRSLNRFILSGLIPCLLVSELPAIQPAVVPPLSGACPNSLITEALTVAATFSGRAPLHVRTNERATGFRRVSTIPNLGRWLLARPFYDAVERALFNKGWPTAGRLLSRVVL